MLKGVKQAYFHITASKFTRWVLFTEAVASVECINMKNRLPQTEAKAEAVRLLSASLQSLQQITQLSNVVC